MSFLFDRLTDPLALPLPVLEQYAVLAAIGFLAYVIAYQRVGSMYRRHSVDTRLAGSILHWLIRLIVFVAIWAVTYIAIIAGRFVLAHWVPILATVCILLGLGVLIWLFFRKRTENARNEEQQQCPDQPLQSQGGL